MSTASKLCTGSSASLGTVYQSSAWPVSWRWRTWAVTGWPLRQLMKRGSVLLTRWPRFCSSRIMANVVSL